LGADDYPQRIVLIQIFVSISFSSCYCRCLYLVTNSI